jgi:hypothetical protein
MKYKIETRDGMVVRKVATRPYEAGWVKRDPETNAVITAEQLTINPKNEPTPQGAWAYETLRAIPIYDNIILGQIIKLLRGKVADFDIENETHSDHILWVENLDKRHLKEKVVSIDTTKLRLRIKITGKGKI